MVTSLEILKKDINSFRDSQKAPTLESGVFLFMSFDLSGSTVFKTEHPTLWASVFTNFYGQMLTSLGVEDYKTPDYDGENSCVRKLWKLIGDEILLYVRVRKASDLYTQITSVNSVLENVMSEIAQKVDEESRAQGCVTECTKHCKNISDIIMSSLGIKTSMWVARCYENNPVNAAKAANIVYQLQTPTPRVGGLDFLGKDIDEGFRMSKYAVKNKIVVSPLLAWLIWKESLKSQDNKKIVKANFKITSFEQMKGVWKNRKVPIVMFHQHFENFETILEYDELDLETYKNIREVGFEKFKADTRFEVDTLDRILDNVFQKREAEEIYKELENTVEIEVQSDYVGKLQEFHIACILLDENNNILVHRSESRGLEFGCVKKIFGVGANSWKDVCIKGYKEKYGLDIDLEDNPIPVATYFYKNSNAFGIILLAKYIDGARDLADWQFYTREQIEKCEKPYVDNFIENAQKAIIIKKQKGEDNG